LQASFVIRIFAYSQLYIALPPFFLAFGQTHSINNKLDPQTSIQPKLSFRRTTARQRPYRPSAKHISAFTVCKTRIHIPAVVFISRNRLVLKGGRTSSLILRVRRYNLKDNTECCYSKVPLCSQLLAINADCS